MVSNTSLDCNQPFLRFPEVAGATWTRLFPLASTVQHDLQRFCGPLLDNLRPHFHRATQWTDTQLAGLPPWQIAVLAIASTWLATTLYRWLSTILSDIRDVGKHTIKQPRSEWHLQAYVCFAMHARIAADILVLSWCCQMMRRLVMADHACPSNRHYYCSVLICRCASNVNQHVEGSAHPKWLGQARSG